MNHTTVRIAIAAFGALIIAVAQGACSAAEKPEVKLTQVFAITSYSDGLTFRTPQAVAVDPIRGDIYAADTANSRIVVLDSTGGFITSFNHRPGGDLESQPIGIVVDKTGQVYVTDSKNPAIFIYDFRGKQTGKITLSGFDKDTLFGKMAVDSKNSIYAVARNKAQVFVFDQNGVLKRKVGESAGENRLEMIADVALDSSDNVYVLSSQGTAVHIFDLTGKETLQFGKHMQGEQNFSFPSSIDIDSAGRIWITDSFAQCIKIYTGSGDYITSIGGFNFPTDLAFWKKTGQLTILEKNAQRLSGYTVSTGKEAGDAH